ncbi:hypothetical protein [Pyrolobus fumarii]|uniref:hypothetical protein n=1 Tax=Pyrolobus fumarii TaxID=54252 RepID=UPI001432A25E|nr:hypothetical protein [Pyrolobus fumarii]
MQRKRIVIEVRGRKGEYWAETAYAWLREDIADILSREYGVEIDVRFVEEDRDEPVIACCGEVLEEIPGEPGYLIEALKKLLDKVVMSGASQGPGGDDGA